jgi:hypothetical protein
MPWQPSLAYVLLLNKIRQGGHAAISAEKLPDFNNTNVLPLLHLLTDEELQRMFLTTKEIYFHVKSALEMRPVERAREAEVIKRQTKRETSIKKETAKIEKQKKHASKDKTLSPEERNRAKVIEGLTHAGLSEAQAIAQYDLMMGKVKK